MTRTTAYLAALALLAALVASCGGDFYTTPNPDEEPALPYDIDEGGSATRYTDGVTPVVANWLNACVVDFSDQADAIAAKDAPDTVCVSEASYAHGHGEIVAESGALGTTTNLFDVALESTGGALLLSAYNTGPGTSRTRRLVRRAPASAELLEELTTGGDYAAQVATDGERVWRAGAGGLVVEGRDAASLATAPAVTLAAQSELVRSLATNGAHVAVVSASSTTPANNFLRVYPRAGGAALFTVTNPYTPAAGFYLLSVAADGARAYLLTNVDSSGAKARLRAVNVTTGATLWSWAPAYEYASATSPVVRQRVASNGELVAVLTSRRLAVLNAFTGAELWTVDYTDPVEGGYHGLSLGWGPGGRLYVGRRGAATADGLYCYDGATGRAIWSTAAIEPLDLVQDGAGLFVAYSSGSDIRVARVAHESGPLLMQRVEPGARHRRPWSKALVPAGGGR